MQSSTRIAAAMLLGLLFGVWSACSDIKSVQNQNYLDGASEIPPVIDQGQELPPGVDEGSELPPSVDEGSELPPSVDEGQELPLSTDSGCVPKCVDENNNPQCGVDDGCGNICMCPQDMTCNEQQGLCLPPQCESDCAGKSCGEDGCGGSCGECEQGLDCLDGICACVPDCQGKECGTDGCGGTCGTCEWGPCNDSGSCTCNEACKDKVCGDTYPLVDNAVPNAAAPEDPGAPIGTTGLCLGICGRCDGGPFQGSVCLSMDVNGDAVIDSASCGCPQFMAQSFCENNGKQCGSVCQVDCGDCPNIFLECDAFNRCTSIGVNPSE